MWMLPLAVVLAVAAYLLFDLQRWAGTPSWEATAMAVAMGGAVYVAAATLVRGARAPDRRVAIAMVVLPSVFLLAGVAGPLVQALDLTALKLPLRVALGATPPLLLLGAFALGRGLRNSGSGPMTGSA